MSPKDIHMDIVDTLNYNAISPSIVSKFLRLEKFSQSNSPMKKKGKFSSEEKNQIIIKYTVKFFPFSSVRTIVKFTNIPISIVFDILNKQFNHVSKHLRWIPHFLASSQRRSKII